MGLLRISTKDRNHIYSSNRHKFQNFPVKLLYASDTALDLPVSSTLEALTKWVKQTNEFKTILDLKYLSL